MRMVWRFLLWRGKEVLLDFRNGIFFIFYDWIGKEYCLVMGGWVDVLMFIILVGRRLIGKGWNCVGCLVRLGGE